MDRYQNCFGSGRAPIHYKSAIPPSMYDSHRSIQLHLIDLNIEIVVNSSDKRLFWRADQLIQFDQCSMLIALVWYHSILVKLKKLGLVFVFKVPYWMLIPLISSLFELLVELEFGLVKLSSPLFSNDLLCFLFSLHFDNLGIYLEIFFIFP